MVQTQRYEPFWKITTDGSRNSERKCEFLIGSGADPPVESASGYNAGWVASGGHDKILEFNPEVSYSD